MQMRDGGSEREPQPEARLAAALVEPHALHLMLSPKHNEVAGQYLADLEASLREATGETLAPKYAG